MRDAAVFFRAFNWRYRSAVYIALGASIALVGGNAGARDVTSLYRAEVPVADRSDQALVRSARQALKAVLIKLTGDRGVTRREGVGAVLDRSRDLIVQYAYEQGPEAPELKLAVEFDQAALSKQLAAIDVNVWGKERPDTLVWLIVDEGTERHLIGGDDPGNLGVTVFERGDARGIPLILPLMDVEESQHLTYAGDWDGLVATTHALSARYGTASIVTGHLRQLVPGLWEARWQIQVEAEKFAWDTEGDIVELLIDEGVDSLADALARRFADPAYLGGSDQFEVTVFGVQTASDYARVVKYLRSLDAVSDLFVASAAGDHVGFEITARGGSGGLAQSISFGRVLNPVATQRDAYQLLP